MGVDRAGANFFSEDGELSIAELMENLDVLNYHFYYGKSLMNAFRSIDRDGDGVIRYETSCS